jgi:hypothetical protein
VENEKDQVIKRLKRLFQNLDTGMTRDKYLDMMEQLGKEPIESEIPPSEDDLPEIAIVAINTFGMLGDRVYPEIGYMGKDYTNLPHYIEIFEIQDKEFFLEILSWLDSRAIKKSAEQMKRQYDKLKRK